MSAVEEQIIKFILILITSIMSVLMGVFTWMFKKTATRANNANALALELNKRVDKLEGYNETLLKLQTDQAVIKNEMKHINDAVININSSLSAIVQNIPNTRK